MSQGARQRIKKADIERAARMYRTATDAAAALGIHYNSFVRLCRKHGIDTPRERRKAAQEKMEL